MLVQIQRVVHLATASLNSLFGFEERARRCIRGLFGGSLAVYGGDENMQSGGQWECLFRPDSRSKSAARVTSVRSAGAAVPPGSSFDPDHQVRVCVVS